MIVEAAIAYHASNLRSFLGKKVVKSAQMHDFLSQSRNASHTKAAVCGADVVPLRKFFIIVPNKHFFY
ncbi:MAG: hypothetical protein FWD72_00120 [Eggerthellaceae bacterium]|nr:hypothetical protein [Eggerthellaceae bacterium]